MAGAAFKGFPEIVSLLLEKGAEVDLGGEDGRTALMVAAMFNRRDIVTQLLSFGADPHRQDAQGKTAQMVAEAMGAAETAQQLAALSSP
ncbi:ankyrin repeat domain-containing protein [Pseudoroseomonas wenyumeiae]